MSSVSFEPGTNLYGLNAFKHRQADDEHSKIIGPIKVIAASSLINREWLKQGRCSKVRWVMPKQDKIFPCLDIPFYFGLVGSCWPQLRGYLVRDCSVRNGSGLVL